MLAITSGVVLFGLIIAAAFTWLLGVMVFGTSQYWWNPGAPTGDEGWLAPIKVALTIAAGVGGAVALVVAYRKQRLHERDETRQIASEQRAHTAAKREVERGYLDQYAAAVQQIGDGSATVRMAGVYALANLADVWPDRRQQCLDVLCGHLRLPWDSSASEGLASIQFQQQLPEGGGTPTLTYPDPRGEREVRETILRVIGDHLKPSTSSTPGWARSSSLASWSNLRLNLTDARLPRIDWAGCVLGKISFRGTTFTEDARFYGTRFTEQAYFEATGFCARAEFTAATFEKPAQFERARFTSNGDFTLAEFLDAAHFSAAEFNGAANFDSSKFAEFSTFDSGVFRDVAYFRHAAFSRDRAGEGAGGAVFSDAEFASLACFDEAVFCGPVDFASAAFEGSVRFAKAHFQGNLNFYLASVGALDSGKPSKPLGDVFEGTAAVFSFARFENGLSLPHARFGCPTIWSGAQVKGKIDLLLGGETESRTYLAQYPRVDEATYNGAQLTGKDLGWDGPQHVDPAPPAPEN